MASHPSISPVEALPIEMTNDPRFRRRIARLVLISAVALGLMTLLVVSTTDAGWLATWLMIAGWVAMPTLLAASLARPSLRFLLAIPAAAVSASLLIVATGHEGSVWVRIGWWLMTSGVLFGGTLGTWFWYRWAPVPHRLNEAFSPGRWVLIAVHAGLIVAGGATVTLVDVL